MHRVVKDSWVRSSLGNVEQWVTRVQAMVPLPSPDIYTHTCAQAIRSSCRKPVQDLRLAPTSSICSCALHTPLTLSK